MERAAEVQKPAGELRTDGSEGRALMVRMAELARRSLQNSAIDSTFPGSKIYLLSEQRYLEIKVDVNSQSPNRHVKKASLVDQNDEGRGFETGIDAFITKALKDSDCIGFIPVDETVYRILTQNHNLNPAVVGEPVPIDGYAYRAVIFNPVTALHNYMNQVRRQ